MLKSLSEPLGGILLSPLSHSGNAGTRRYSTNTALNDLRKLRYGFSCFVIWAACPHVKYHLSISYYPFQPMMGTFMHQGQDSHGHGASVGIGNA